MTRGERRKSKLRRGRERHEKGQRHICVTLLGPMGNKATAYCRLRHSCLHHSSNLLLTLLPLPSHLHACSTSTARRRSTPRSTRSTSTPHRHQTQNEEFVLCLPQMMSMYVRQCVRVPEGAACVWQPPLKSICLNKPFLEVHPRCYAILNVDHPLTHQAGCTPHHFFHFSFMLFLCFLRCRTISELFLGLCAN